MSSSRAHTHTHTHSSTTTYLWRTRTHQFTRTHTRTHHHHTPVAHAHTPVHTHTPPPHTCCARAHTSSHAHTTTTHLWRKDTNTMDARTSTQTLWIQHCLWDGQAKYSNLDVNAGVNADVNETSWQFDATATLTPGTHNHEFDKRSLNCPFATQQSTFALILSSLLRGSEQRQANMGCLVHSEDRSSTSPSTSRIRAYAGAPRVSPPT